ncbi:flavohemoglobin expression-modulating QEGLA motif protein [Mycoplana rhizolycopersici]|jgi:uncharacterized protein (TIGR02421 family)|uniref:Flavohemoglobin expression-modulating QEGLA motif protein n=1 Tax=Mycoplana rhizolycopersici TaxID=2746702 RepID=A0ABX2QN64_9HYPH|nr:flavohemoglobin expression-modulating QEGLA motif protein [Rhizobium rhizolycopersici]NVP58337.1 flavohemoglobin expression-modulating QEGLA motif protein [Rhizobium rhizolycopersici]
MTGKTAAIRKPSRGTFPFIEKALERLEAGQTVRHEFEGGRLHIDRPLPFLTLCIGDLEEAPVARDVTASSASYLLVRHIGDALLLIRPIADVLKRRFGAFVLLDVDELERDRLLSEDAPFLQPFEVAISATAGPSEKQAMKTFVAAVKEFHARFRTPRIDACDASEDPCVRPELLDLRLPLLTLRFAPIYRVPGTDDIYPELRERLVDNFLDAGLQAFVAYVAEEGLPKPVTHRAFGRKAFIDAVERADRSIDNVATSFDLLLAVTPINTNAAWEEFRASSYTSPPRFLYRPLTLHVEREKRRLHSIPLDRLEDPVLHHLYREKQQELDLQLSLIADRESTRFIDLGRALYGTVEPSLVTAALQILQEINDARHAAPSGADNADVADAAFVERYARKMLSAYFTRFPCFDATIEVRDDLPAGLMVSGPRLLISRQTRMLRRRVDALLSHEVGVHLLTYFNGSAQGLRIFRTGLSGYEGMQEGLAVFAEYLAGGFTVERLRLLAARVIGCHMMLGGASFVDSFRSMTHDHGLDSRLAFELLLRIYRGGGLAKDAIYLRGLLSLLEHLKAGGALDPFWMGKISAAHFGVMQELAQRGLLKAPILRPLCLEHDDGRRRLERAREGISPLAMLQP